ncbi:alpha/beta hydrolase [Aestuariivivens sediminicola]|uniref:alpha/beta hydrolase n=1 Tax=Aestuariivivens sediminicola TaxID=2913560 RepID=UPI001F5651E0|nr:alpha/beta hydrolase-fold protein [Aestuariivivens sediminicola]
MRLFFKLMTLAISIFCFGQGRIESTVLKSEALINIGGEDPNRKLTIYLPPNYDRENKNYPVVYYLPGIGMPNEWMMDQLQPIIENAIAINDIEPVILVIPDHYTLYQGSYFSNSSLIGDWITFTKKEVVDYMDSNYRTIAKKESRALVGWSSGGFGALKIGMQSSEVFSNIYALSPGLLILSDEFAPNSTSYKELEDIDDPERLQKEWIGIPNVLVASGRAFAPNPNNPPYFADFPTRFVDGKKIIDEEVLIKWNSELPYNMIENYMTELRSLTSLKLEWGRNDDFKNVVSSCRAFSKKLENLEIDHIAEEYNGTHFNRIFGTSGRLAKDMLPFLNDHLSFE